jgi:type IX secretion system PorP/SprF family membrane protein
MKYFYAFVLLISVRLATAQDIHFSQYYAAPINLNPANTANINGTFRAAANYRNQWFLIPVSNEIAPYQTVQGSFDMAVLRNKLGNDGFGFGVNVYHDRAGNGSLVTNSAMASIAYHKAVDRYGRSRFSLGFQAGIVQKQVNLNNLIFESQLDPSGTFWDENISNQEADYTAKSILYPDMNIGAMWTSMPKPRFRYYLGFSLNHIARPRESFLNDQQNRLQHRYVVHGGMEIFTNRKLEFSFAPTFLMMLQNNAQQYQVGLAFNNDYSETLGWFASVSGRINTTGTDAAIIGAGIEVYDVRIGLSYDVNLSGLRTASRAQGAAEIGVVYIFGKERTGPIQYHKYCPRF